MTGLPSTRQNSLPVPDTQRKPKIRRLRRRKDRDGLVAALTWQDWELYEDGEVADVGARTRRDALVALVDLDGGLHPDALAIALADDHEGVRLWALASAESVDSLEEQHLTTIAYAAASWPEGTHDDAFERAVVLLERDPVFGVREYSRAALNHDAPLDDRTRATIERLADRADGTAGWDEVLAAALDVPTSRPRVEPLLELGAERVPHRIDEALEMPGRRPGAIRALGLRRDSALVGDLVEHLEDPDPAIRREVAVALGRIKHPSAIGELFDAAQDDSYEVRDAAMKALDGFGTVAVTAAVLAAQGEPPAAQIESGGHQPPQQLPAASNYHAGESPHRSGGLIARMRHVGLLPCELP